MSDREHALEQLCLFLTAENADLRLELRGRVRITAADYLACFVLPTLALAFLLAGIRGLAYLIGG